MKLQPHPALTIDGSLLNEAAKAIGHYEWPAPWEQDDWVLANLAALLEWQDANQDRQATLWAHQAAADANAEARDKVRAKARALANDEARAKAEATAKAEAADWQLQNARRSSGGLGSHSTQGSRYHGWGSDLND